MLMFGISLVPYLMSAIVQYGSSASDIDLQDTGVLGLIGVVLLLLLAACMIPSVNVACQYVLADRAYCWQPALSTVQGYAMCGVAAAMGMSVMENLSKPTVFRFVGLLQTNCSFTLCCVMEDLSKPTVFRLIGAPLFSVVCCCCRRT